MHISDIKTMAVNCTPKSINQVVWLKNMTQSMSKIVNPVMSSNGPIFPFFSFNTTNQFVASIHSILFILLVNLISDVYIYMKKT